MEKLNTLPMQTYVRTRASTIVTNVEDLSSGTVTLNLAKPSDVTVILACLTYSGAPQIFVAAIGRTPTLLDFDVIMSPTDQQFVKGQSRVTLRLPEGQHEFRWKSCTTDEEASAFGDEGSRLVIAIDQ